MTKTCPSCEILAPPDARYCRHCGTQLKRVGAVASGEHISPIAATMPLSGQNTTDEIVAPHPSPSSANAHTSEVTHEELDDLLQQPQGDTRSREVRHAEAGSASDGHQHAPARDAGVSSANYTDAAKAADNFRAASPDFSADDFDPEQTQITINVRPLTSRNLPADAAAASVATTRPTSKPQFNPAPQQVTLSPTGSLPTASDAATTNASPSPSTLSPPAAATRSTESRALRVWLGMGVAILSIVVICGVAFAAFWYGSRAWRNSQTPPATAGGESAPVTSDPKQLAEAKLAEADALIASGNAQEAQARLREAAALDPLNAETQRRLARLLLASGARREGIEALRAVTRLAPTDAEAWRTLASAQSAEGLYEDALESYRALGDAAPAVFARDASQLAYADALRMSGRTGEARVIYRRLVTSSDAEVANASRQQLGLPSPTATTDEDTEDADAHTAGTDARAATIRAEETARTTTGTSSALPATPEPTAPPRPAPSTTATTTTPARASTGSPSEQYQRGVGLWATNRAAAVAEFRAAAERGHSDASYYLGLSIAEGREPRALKRAELVAAIVYFGRARRGKFRAQAVSYEDQLGRELDRRRSQ